MDIADVSLAIGGDRAAFSRIYENIAPELLRFAVYRLGNLTDAQDAVSDTFLEALKGISRLRNSESFRPWIFKILVAKCNRHIGRYISDRASLKDELDPVLQDNLGDFAGLWDAMARLSDSEREMILLNAVHGYTAAEISEICSMPQGTVSSKIYRGLQKLKRMLA